MLKATRDDAIAIDPWSYHVREGSNGQSLNWIAFGTVSVKYSRQSEYGRK